jgi:CRISPR-associated protein Csb1
MSVQLAGKDLEAIVADQESELSAKTVEDIRKEAVKAKTKPLSASRLGLGGIPPSLESLGAVACRRIIRSHVLSFSALRQLRFGSSLEGDAACRALLAALALSGLARSDAGLSLRANCDLVEFGHATVVLDERYGNRKELVPLTIAEADALLGVAIDNAAEKADVQWDGQVLDVEGNPIVLGGAVAEVED